MPERINTGAAGDKSSSEITILTNAFNYNYGMNHGNIIVARVAVKIVYVSRNYGTIPSNYG